MLNKEYILTNGLTKQNTIKNKILSSLTDLDKDYLMTLYNDSESYQESLYRYVFDLHSKPKCKTCSTELKFNTRANKFSSHYCSLACMNRNKEIINKQRISNRKNFEEKCKQLGRQIPTIRNKNFRDEFGNLIKINKQRELKTLENTGRITGGDVSRRKSIQLWKSRGYDIEYTNDDMIALKNGCEIHGDIKLSKTLFNNRMKPERRNVMCICPLCNPPKSGITSIEVITKRILDELDIKYIYHDYEQIKPRELDFFLPDYNIAIECNGMYWHSLNWQRNVKEESKLVHFNKRKYCEEKNIYLLNFWEHDLNFKDEQIYSLIMKLTNKSEKISNIEFKVITKNEVLKFIKYNSLYKFENVGDILLGGYYDNQLVCAVSIKDNEVTHICELNGYDIDKNFILKYIKEHYSKVNTLKLNLDYNTKEYWKQYINNFYETNDKFFYNRLDGKYLIEYNELNKDIYECYTSGTLICKI